MSVDFGVVGRFLVEFVGFVGVLAGFDHFGGYVGDFVEFGPGDAVGDFFGDGGGGCCCGSCC